MIEAPNRPEPTIADPPSPTPNPLADAWVDYQHRAHGAVVASQTVLDSLRALLEGRGGSFEDFRGHITTLEVAYRELGTAARALEAIATSSGTA